nr:MAG TPA: chitin synthase regulator [Caudoviricetes sp.]
MDYTSFLENDHVINDIADYLQMCQTLFWIIVVIDIIVLIAFFILCNNIAKIKKTIYGKSKFESIFNFYVSIGNMKKAEECLFKQILNDEYLDEAFFSTAEYSEKMRKYFQDRYQVYFDELNLKLDFDKVDRILKQKSS